MATLPYKKAIYFYFTSLLTSYINYSTNNQLTQSAVFHEKLTQMRLTKTH